MTAEPDTGTHKIDDLLTCRAPWRCTVSQRLRGVAASALKKRYGTPYWDQDGEIIFRAPRDCASGSQWVRFRMRRGRVHRVSFSWKLGDVSCHPGLSTKYAPMSKHGLLRGCGRFGKRCAATRRLRGMTESAIIANFGFPHDAEGRRWTYFWPRGCSDRRAELRLTWRRGRVNKAHWRARYTGEHCPSPF